MKRFLFLFLGILLATTFMNAQSSWGSKNGKVFLNKSTDTLATETIIPYRGNWIRIGRTQDSANFPNIFVDC
mgnify:CR=1 FL=1